MGGGMAATILCQQALLISPPFPAAFLSSTGEPVHRLWFLEKKSVDSTLEKINYNNSQTFAHE